MNIDNHLENRMWFDGVGGERLPFAQTCKNLHFCHQRDREFLSSVYRTRAAKCFSQTLGRRPPHITGRRVNTVSLGWVGATNERAPFRVHDAVIGFDDQYLTRFQIADQGVGVSHNCTWYGLCPRKLCDDRRVWVIGVVVS